MDRRQFLVATSLSALGATLPNLAFAASGDAALYALMDRTFEGDLRLEPQTATDLGLDKGFRAWMKSRLDDRSAPGDAAKTNHARQMLAEIRAVSPESLSELAAVRREIVLDMLGTRLAAERFGIKSEGAPYRLSQQDGAYFEIPDFLDSSHPIETADDAEAYLARLSAFPLALDDESEAQRADAARGYLAPRWSLDLVAKQIGNLLDSPAAESGMVTSLANRAQAKNVAGDWRTRATKIVGEAVYPALQRQLELVGRLHRSSRGGDGIWRVPRGDEIYAAALERYTTTKMSPDEIHRVGVTQVAEISAELDGILKTAGLSQGSIGARLTALNTRPDQLFANDDAGRKALIDSLNAGVEAMHGKLGQAFATLPTQPLEIRRVPVEIQDGASNGYYNIATLDGSRPAIYWINLKNTGDWPKYSLPALTYHEGSPGHHLHLSLMQQEAALPMLLKNYWLSSYGEGWGLYAESVADELGGYTGLEKAGALQSWLFRAARLVVDTGVNDKRWSRERATDYLVDKTGFTRARSQREIERYCASPGQACSYKIGQNVWLASRARAEQALGSRFDLKQFHEILKEGVMPLSLLERRVDAWVARVKGG